MSVPETADRLLKNTKMLDEFVQQFLNAGYRENQLIAVILVKVFNASPGLFKTYEADFIEVLRDEKAQNCTLRNTLRLLNGRNISLKFHTVMFDCCLKLASDPHSAAAIKAYSLAQLEWLTKRYPELLPEVRTMIEPQLAHEKKSFLVRARFLTANLLASND